MKLIVKADDFGFTEAVNLGIIKSYKDGIVTSTALMVNMPSAVHGVFLAKDYPMLCLGLHINLVVGKPISAPEEIPSLIQGNGCFKSSKMYRELIAQGMEPILNVEEAMIEVEAQIKRFYELTGHMPEYFEGHAIASENLNLIYHQMAKKYGLLHVSHNKELSHGITAYPCRSKSVYPWYEQGLSPELFFTENACDVLDKKLALVCMHPGYLDHSIMELSSFTTVRANDLYALTHPETIQWIKDNNIELISFRSIKEHIG